MPLRKRRASGPRLRSSRCTQRSRNSVRGCHRSSRDGLTNPSTATFPSPSKYFFLPFLITVLKFSKKPISELRKSCLLSATVYKYAVQCFTEKPLGVARFGTRRRSAPCRMETTEHETNMATISIGISEPCTLTERVSASAASALNRFTLWTRSAWCRLNGGHYKVLHTEPKRMALRCVACGHTSPGWNVGSPRLARTIAGDPERLRVRRVEVA